MGAENRRLVAHVQDMLEIQNGAWQEESFLKG